jgi:hypothetical protein
LDDYRSLELTEDDEGGGAESSRAISIRKIFLHDAA